MFLSGTSTRRRNEAISRLNSLYLEILPTKKTIQKCLKFLCEKESYRMLKDWSYDNSSDPLQSESEVDNTDLDNATNEILVNLSQEIAGKRKGASRRKSEKNSQVHMNKKRKNIFFSFFSGKLHCFIKKIRQEMR